MHLDPILNASPAIQLHALAAVSALLLGAAVLWQKKGGPRHRLQGRLWVALMVITSLSGLFIHEIRMFGNFSPIHLLSILVPIALARAVMHARRGRIEEHRRIMRLTFVWGMLVAGGFTFMPGRINYQILFGETRPMALLSAHGGIILLMAAMVIALWFARKSRIAARSGL